MRKPTIIMTSAITALTGVLLSVGTAVYDEITTSRPGRDSVNKTEVLKQTKNFSNDRDNYLPLIGFGGLGMTCAGIYGIVIGESIRNRTE